MKETYHAWGLTNADKFWSENHKGEVYFGDRGVDGSITLH